MDQVRDVVSTESPGPIAAWVIEQVVGRGEHEVRRLATAQRGFALREQLFATGLGRGAIEHRIAGSSLAVVHPGVYLVGHDALAPFALELAAVLYYRGHAVLSHQTAAAVWGFADQPQHHVELTLVGRDARSRPGVRLSRTVALDLRDVRRRDGLPVTAPARTLIDYAGRVSFAEAERALMQLRVLKLARDSELRAAMDRCPSRKGVGRVRGLIAAERDSGFTRLAAEQRMRTLVKRAQLPTPEFNAALRGYEVDVLWRALGVVIEVDGHAVHGHRGAFERDRRRDQILAAAGYTVIRVTWRQLVQEPVAVITRVAQALALAQAGQAQR